MNRVLVAAITVVLLYSPGFFAFAAEQCPAVNCDCSSLAKPSWQAVCESHEKRIKKECALNSNTPKEYCLVHGTNAAPLPLALKVSPYENTYFAMTEFDVSKKLKSLLWGINADVDQVVALTEKKDFAMSMKVLKLIDANIDEAFEQQQILAQANLQSSGQMNVFATGRSSWKQFSIETTSSAQKLQKLAKTNQNAMLGAKTKKERKIYSVLAQKAFRMAGKSFEQVGYAYGMGGNHTLAAAAWQQASEQSDVLVAIGKKLKANASGIKFSEYQAAARLHRASYHWLKTENVIESERVLYESQQYLGRNEQKSLGALLERLEGENLLDGELTGR